MINPPTEKTLELREGSRLILPTTYPMTLREMYFFAVNVSGAFDGKLVSCINFLPGTTLDFRTRWRTNDGVHELENEWRLFQTFLLDWVDALKPGFCCASFLWFTNFELWRGAARRHDTPAIEIVRQLPWDAPFAPESTS